MVLYMLRWISSFLPGPHHLTSWVQYSSASYLPIHMYMYIYKGSIPIGGCPPAIQRGYGNLVSDGYGGLHMMADFA